MALCGARQIGGHASAEIDRTHGDHGAQVTLLVPREEAEGRGTLAPADLVGRIWEWPRQLGRGVVPRPVDRSLRDARLRLASHS